MASPRTVHVPVMVHEVLEQLDLSPGLTVLDGTVGAGGHGLHILQALQADSPMSPTPDTPPPDEATRPDAPTAAGSGLLIGLDRDPAMLDRAAQVLQGPRVVLRQGSYAELDGVLEELEIEQIDRVLLDLGLSSDQLADRERGFGIDAGGELDMRFDTSVGIPAAELLATAEESELERIFAEYGEVPQAAAIASEIVTRRKRGEPVTRAEQLVEVGATYHGSASRVPKRSAKHGSQSRGTRRGSGAKSHPATRLFQSLRIAVNHELDQLETFLSDVLPRRLRSGGRAVIITFHSLEDRLVKQAFREVDTWHNLTRKPIVPTPSEIRLNPRSRSAKLRVAVRT
jgi:16S rRNA (cytosine1402-N4)-methyltransferase